MMRRSTNSGFTLLEALLACVVLSIAVLGLTLPLVSALQNDREDARRTMAINLAQDMMEEVLSRSFTEPNGANGREPREKRHGLYECMNDYASVDEPEGQIADAAGNFVTDLSATGLSRHTAVTYFVLGSGTSNNAASIIVEVKYHGQPVVTLTRLFYNQQM